MKETPETVRRAYYVLTAGNTLAASLIWGINTIFLLDAGLSNFEAFAANAFYTAGMVLFEIPDRDRGRLLGPPGLIPLRHGHAGGDHGALCPALAEHSAFVWWAIVSALLGLGFTFFSGATEAWLVDALTATGFTGQLETVFSRGQVVAGTRC